VRHVGKAETAPTPTNSTPTDPTQTQSDGKKRGRKRPASRSPQDAPPTKAAAEEATTQPNTEGTDTDTTTDDETTIADLASQHTLLSPTKAERQRTDNATVMEELRCDEWRSLKVGDTVRVTTAPDDNPEKTRTAKGVVTAVEGTHFVLRYHQRGYETHAEIPQPGRVIVSLLRQILC
jgi:hypothetical protein